MLTEGYVAAIRVSGKASTNSALKDIGIQFHEFQPISAVRSNLKKSSTPTRCLAVSSTHVFAAQAEKAVVHVYNREKGNQEAVVPFHERIHSIVLVGDNGGILVLGTEGGRLIIWETCTGRQVTTTASHLQPVIALAIDPSHNFILSASSDSNIHVWSLPSLLSFAQPSSLEQNQAQSNSPLRTLSNHRTAITDLVVGHSQNRSNIAISISKDSTANVWDYSTGVLLHTYLLPAVPSSLTLDPADRSVYVGYEDGSISCIDFTKYSSAKHVLHDSSQQYTPTQISPKDTWAPPSQDFGTVYCVTSSYDGTVILSGHANGKVLIWDVAKGRYSATATDLGQPVTNLQMLVPTGFLGSESKIRHTTVHNIVKPRFDHGGNPNLASGSIPSNYSIQAQIASPVGIDHTAAAEKHVSTELDEFHVALTHPSIPASLISSGLAELASYNLQPASKTHSQTKASARQQQSPEDSGEESANGTGNSIEKNALLAHSGLPPTTPESLQSLISEYETIRRQHAQQLITLHQENSVLQQRIAKSEKLKLERALRRDERATKRREAWLEADRRGQDADKVMQEMELADGDAGGGSSGSDENEF